MAISHKYRTFDQLLNDVTIDFRTYALEGMIEPQQLIKVALRVNYDLGIRINRTKDTVIEVEHNKAQLPMDFKYLNYAWVCGNYKVVNTPPSGTHVDTTQPAYVPAPDGGDVGPCDDPTCKDVCVVKTCEGTKNESQYMLIQNIGAQQYREYSEYFPLRIKNHVTGGKTFCEGNCPNINEQAVDIAEIRDKHLITNFKAGNVYLNYQGAMENEEGDLLVLDHPYCNEYYEYALKERILENMLFSGENVSQQMQLIQGKLRAARNNALGFINTPDFKEVQKIWEVNRRAQYHNYYNMFKSHASIR